MEAKKKPVKKKDKFNFIFYFAVIGIAVAYLQYTLIILGVVFVIFMILYMTSNKFKLSINNKVSKLKDKYFKKKVKDGEQGTDQKTRNG